PDMGLRGGRRAVRTGTGQDEAARLTVGPPPGTHGGCAMLRSCTGCGKVFRPSELARAESRGMEAERQGLGWGGGLFRFYPCHDCGQADIFLDLRPLDGETDESFHARRDDLEYVVRELSSERDEAEVVVAVR